MSVKYDVDFHSRNHDVGVSGVVQVQDTTIDVRQFMFRTTMIMEFAKRIMMIEVAFIN
jgi:hypothetical protein